MTGTDETTTSHQVGALRAERRGDSIVVLDRSCGGCPTCRTGFRLWCTNLGPEREQVAFFTTRDPRSVLRSLTAAAAFVGACVDPQAVVLVLDDSDDDPMSIAGLVRSLHSGAVYVTSDSADPAIRAGIAAASPHGRADVVVASLLARDAVKAVVRGGVVCLSADAVEAPTVTELVQREVRLVGARSVQDVLERVA